MKRAFTCASIWYSKCDKNIKLKISSSNTHMFSTTNRQGVIITILMSGDLCTTKTAFQQLDTFFSSYNIYSRPYNIIIIISRSAYKRSIIVTIISYTKYYYDDDDNRMIMSERRQKQRTI